MFFASPESFEVKVSTLYPELNGSDTQIGTNFIMTNRKKYFIFSPKNKEINYTKSIDKNSHILRATAF